MKPLKRNQGSVMKRVLAIFIGNHPRALTIVEITKTTGSNRSSIKTAIYRLYKAGLLIRRGRGTYMLRDRNLAVALLESKVPRNGFTARSEPKVGETVHTFAGDGNTVRRYYGFLDLGSVILEHARVRFGLKMSVADKIRRGWEE